MKLRQIERTKSSAWYRTPDDRFDVLGGDLNTNNAAGRAAGAGAVWAWQPADPTGAWTNDIHPFTNKRACLADLEQHIAAEDRRARRVPDPVDLMMSGEYTRAIAAYRAIIAESGDPLGICEKQIAACEAHIAAVQAAAPVAPRTVIMTCVRCTQQNRVIVGVSSRCGKCKLPIPDGAAALVAAYDDGLL